MLELSPFGDGTHIESERLGRLGRSEALATQVVTNLAVGFIVEHDGAPGPGVGSDLRVRYEFAHLVWVWVWVWVWVLVVPIALGVLTAAVVKLAWPSAAWALPVSPVRPARTCWARPALGTVGPARQ